MTSLQQTTSQTSEILVAIALLFLLDRLSQPLRILPPVNINRTAFS
ncbi:MAG: hypothetical protein WBA89_09050 [Microcoleus sp.]